MGACVGSEPFASSGVADSGDATAVDASTPNASDGSSPTSGDSSVGAMDAAGDANLGTDGGAWTPKTGLPGLALWLDSETGVTFDGTAKLTSWADQSGNANNGTVIAPCVGPSRALGSLNGHETLAFAETSGGSSGACIAIADSPSLQFGTGDFAVFLVARYANAVGLGAAQSPAGALWKKYLPPSGPPFTFTGVSFVANSLDAAVLVLAQNNLSGNRATGATAGLNNNTFHRFGGTRVGLNMDVWLDGTADGHVALSVATDVSQVGQMLFIGGDPSATKAWLTGNVAEVVGVKGTISSAQIAQLDAYFKAKHGL